MIRERQINIAASKYIEDNSVGGEVCISSHKDSFIEGAEWADEHPKEGLVDLSQVWHEVKEEPKEGTQVVVIDHDGWTGSGLFNPMAMIKGVYLYGELIVDWYSVVRWAYLKDLSPKGGEQ